MTANNLQIVSGVLRLNKENGSARVNLKTGAVSGDACPDSGEGGVRGATGRSFRSTPHAIISPSDVSLSTKDNTSYRISRHINRDLLSIYWRIDSPVSSSTSTNNLLEIDFLVVGEAA